MKHTARFFTGQAVSAIILASLWNQPIDDQGWLDTKVRNNPSNRLTRSSVCAERHRVLF